MEIKDMFSKERVCLQLGAENKLEAIDEVIDILVKDGKINDKETFRKAVLKREEEFSTGIGMGIAIPHGKSDSVNEAAIVFGKSNQGIDYGSMDDKPAHLFFLIAVPQDSNDIHLRALSQISRKLMHENVRNAIMNSSNFEEFIKVFE